MYSKEWPLVSRKKDLQRLGQKPRPRLDLVQRISGLCAAHMCFTQMCIAATLFLNIRVERLSTELIVADPITAGQEKAHDDMSFLTENTSQNNARYVTAGLR